MYKRENRVIKEIKKGKGGDNGLLKGLTKVQEGTMGY